MLLYIIKRILIFFPTLIIISFIAFGLSKCTPGDPVESMRRFEGELNTDNALDAAYAERVYLETAELLGLDKPVFYFNLTTAAYPDSLYKYLRQDRRKALSKLIAQYGNWPEIEKYYLHLRATDQQLFQIPDTIAPAAYRKIRAAVKQLYISYKAPVVEAHLNSIGEALLEQRALSELLSPPFNELSNQYDRIRAQKTVFKNWIPVLHWNGFDNQYHRWMSRFFLGDFGISYEDNRPVGRKIGEAIKWTLLINFCALLLVFIIAIPIGVWAAAKAGSRFDRSTSLILFLLYALPNFWLATLLLVFFTTPEYGMKLFAGIGLGQLPSDAPFWSRFWETAGHLILPVWCVSYGALAFISRQMRGSILEVIQEDYIRTARAKGLGRERILWKHAFRNALFPIITLIAGVFPAMLAGSVIIEVIFNIPGMGRLAYDALILKDWPVVYTILMLGAVLTILGILCSDLIYAKTDPRVTFTQSTKT